MDVLITGATGNVGAEIIKQLKKVESEVSISLAVRNIEKAQKNCSISRNMKFVTFDFENASTFRGALNNIDVIFLLRPPHISDIKKYFEPLIKVIAEKVHINVVFLSVQGAEHSTIIPHRKIELLIQKYKLAYIFMRPSYFMQNLTTTLNDEIKKVKTITLPSGKALFNWVDITNVAELGVKFILEFEQYKNTSFTITGAQNLNFFTVVEKINKICKSNIAYINVDPINYFFKKKKEKIHTGKIIVMLILHFLPRIQKEPEIANTYNIFHRDPNNIEDFIERNKKSFI